MCLDMENQIYYNKNDLNKEKFSTVGPPIAIAHNQVFFLGQATNMKYPGLIRQK